MLQKDIALKDIYTQHAEAITNRYLLWGVRASKARHSVIHVQRVTSHQVYRAKGSASLVRHTVQCTCAICAKNSGVWPIRTLHPFIVHLCSILYMPGRVILMMGGKKIKFSQILLSRGKRGDDSTVELKTGLYGQVQDILLLVLLTRYTSCKWGPPGGTAHWFSITVAHQMALLTGSVLQWPTRWHCSLVQYYSVSLQWGPQGDLPPA